MRSEIELTPVEAGDTFGLHFQGFCNSSSILRFLNKYTAGNGKHLKVFTAKTVQTAFLNFGIVDCK